MTSFMRPLIVWCLFTLSTNIVGDETEDREKRLAELTRFMTEFRIQSGSDRQEELVLVKEPALRYSDAIASQRFIEIPDGALFVWTRNGRPAAISSVHLGSSGRYWTEFLSLRAEPMVGSRKDGKLWSSGPSQVEFQAVPDAPLVKPTMTERAVQMKAFCQTFSASIADPEAGRQELRVLPKPVYRYSQPEEGVLDGAIFVFARGTNPEMLLVFEARQTQVGNVAWMYAPARYTGRQAEMSCPGGRTWSHEAIHGQRDPTAPFFQISLASNTDGN